MLSSVVCIFLLSGFFRVSCGEGECIRTDPIMCYNCDSANDRRCRDPFNYSLQEQIRSISCKGCCVKLVRRYNTPYERIRRLCTRQLDLNLFMIDHVCMNEHDKTGHMCMCESDFCNRSSRQSSLSCALIIMIGICSVIFQRIS
ncbi:Uncharacterised protein g7795 [Pycnogonum litorale]